MNHVSICEDVNFSGIQYRIIREDGVILATTCIKHYADVILKAIAADIEKNDNEDV